MNRVRTPLVCAVVALAVLASGCGDSGEPRPVPPAPTSPEPARVSPPARASIEGGLDVVRPDGQRVELYRVRDGRRGDAPIATAQIGPGGSFRFAGLAPGRYLLIGPSGARAGRVVVLGPDDQRRDVVVR